MSADRGGDELLPKRMRPVIAQLFYIYALLRTPAEQTSISCWLLSYLKVLCRRRKPEEEPAVVPIV
jgi:hypothetical protein